MKIRIDRETVEFEPETTAEAMDLEALWKKLGGGLGDGKMTPDGLYSKRIDRYATFKLLDLTDAERHQGPTMPFEGDVICKICGHKKHLKAGDPIPMCCGKLMNIL